MSKILAQSIFSSGRPHNDTRINASNVSSFNRLLRSLFTPIPVGKSMFTYNHACQSEVAVKVQSKLQSRNCKSYWNLKVSARVPRLESNCVFIRKLEPLYFVTSSFWRGLHCEGWKLCRAHFCEVPQAKTKKTFLTPKMAFDKC